MKKLFPMMLDLEGVKVTVFGGGEVARRKVYAMLDTGANIKVVSPEIKMDMRNLISIGKIDYICEEYTSEHLVGSMLVFACTDNPEVNDQIVQYARSIGVLVNRVDDPDDCDFVLPSFFRRGDLTIAVSTAGDSPALSHQLREKLKAEFPSDWEQGMEIIREAREKVKNICQDKKKRREILIKFGSEDVVALIEARQWDGLNRLVAGYIASLEA